MKYLVLAGLGDLNTTLDEGMISYKMNFLGALSEKQAFEEPVLQKSLCSKRGTVEQE